MQTPETIELTGRSKGYANLRPWPKGVSGCPGGKRKEVAKAEKALAKLLPSGVNRLEALLESDNPHLMIEGLKLLFKYTLTTAEKRVVQAQVNQTMPRLSPDLVARIAALDS